MRNMGTRVIPKRLSGTIGVSLYSLLSCWHALLTSKEEGIEEETPQEVEVEVTWRHNRCVCVLLVVWPRSFAHIRHWYLMAMRWMTKRLGGTISASVYFLW